MSRSPGAVLLQKADMPIKGKKESKLRALKARDYIKKHDLQDPQNRRMIRADDNLRPIFDGNEKLSMFEMTAFVSRHLPK